MVANLINDNGRAVANQFVITHENGDIAFQSYNSLVCEIRQKGGMGFDKVICFGSDFNYSKTTMKHLRKFLSDNGYNFNSMAEIYKAIDKGYIVGREEVAVIYDETMV